MIPSTPFATNLSDLSLELTVQEYNLYFLSFMRLIVSKSKNLWLIPSICGLKL